MRADIGDWSELLAAEREMDYFESLYSFLYSNQSKEIYPPKENWYKAFEYSSFANTKVIILGQDPYHGINQAEGLSFSVPEGVPIPPSLRNIYIELESDIGTTIPLHGHLSHWAKQGVLLLNSVLTVAKNSPASHANQGWETFTDNVIKLLNEKKLNLVFLLWGAYAGKKAELINPKRGHLILKAPHPSPFSANKGFFGCKHFSKTNQHLLSTDQTPIEWQIPS